MAATFRFALRWSVSTSVTVLSCTEMKNVPTCISYTVSVVETVDLLYWNTSDDNGVTDKYIFAHRILWEGDFFSSK
jgi:hypothetical protein